MSTDKGITAFYRRGRRGFGRGRPGKAELRLSVFRTPQIRDSGFPRRSRRFLGDLGGKKLLRLYCSRTVVFLDE